MRRAYTLPCTLVLALAGCGDSGRPADDGTATLPTSTTPGLTEPTGTTDAPTGTTTAPTTGEPTTSTTTGGQGTGEAGEQCGVSAECKPGLVCAGGECAPTDGECQTDDDCSGDSYCCADNCLPVGESPAVCIPYGFDPNQWSNDECVGDVTIGLFEPAVQCEWTAPPDGDPYPNHKSVLTTPLIFDLPHGANVEFPQAEIVIVTYNYTDGGEPAGWGSDPNYYGVIRVLDGTTCELIESIDDPANRIIAASPPAIGDIDGDGLAEIVTHRAVSGTIAFGWDVAQKKYVTKWVATDTNYSMTVRWDGPSLHDLDDDGVAEVITGSEVYDGATGTRLNPGQTIAGAGSHRFSVIGDLDQDGAAELIGAGVWRWNVGTNTWEMAWPGDPDGGQHYGFADFGTPGADPASFNATALDGRAEIVSVTGGVVELYTLEGQLIFTATTDLGSGGPPTIGDFDNDGYPEIASAGGKAFSIYDLDCKDVMAPGCVAPWIRWSQPSQDASSQNTGSSIFDFEGDGAAEAVYADECFLRVYEGATGEVLYSTFRTSCTWYENPVVGDPDYDQNTEILVGSNDNCGVVCPDIDPIHRGLRCETGEECGEPFICDAGFCRCSDNTQCVAGHACTEPLAGTPGAGNVCRAVHPPGVGLTGLRVLRDRLDRWASSRPLWNQHAYSVTNVDDDGGIPAISQWPANFLQPDLNNYRQNRQGDTPPAALPDITGKLGDQSCMGKDGKVVLTSTVCNRGKKAVGANLPATFYLGDPADGMVLCVAYTSEPVPVEECRDVSCTIDDTVNGTVTVVVDDDGQGGEFALECFENNNSDAIQIKDCSPIG
ncbi:FG-GAP repeat domain-containing protein [Nannocystis punicea]|uniref:VCBS repeat-containing protein n=1 Tax=Nannocystis punicea TaxID=2995304 RepID=A0ABY7H0R7_9BACT|nr:VCBS repeat-containing protein [Nannocystis poenicansa]WAS92841.1 VCBS repeat-containing protein [Nannocystis poenicansa]